MICSSCGQPVMAGDHFCARCGAPMVATLGPAGSVPMYGYGQPSLMLAVSQESRLWAVAAHLSAIVGAFAAVLGALVGPFAIFMIRKDIDWFAAENARQALNFNLSVLLYGLAMVALVPVTFGVGLIVTIPGLLLLGAAWLLLSLVAALRAWNDGVFRYPFTIEFVK